MRQSKAGNADKACGQLGNQGFTWWELLIVIVCGVFLFLLSFPANITWNTEKSRRACCLCSQNGLWKAASQWGLDPVQTWRPNFPNTNLAYALVIDNAINTPDIFICAGAAKKNSSWGITEATNLASIRATNSNYAYFGGRSNEDGRPIRIADKNGSNNLPSATAWGGNHDGKGGNVILVAGRGLWVSTPSPSNDSLYCITNADIAAAFATTGTVYSY